MPRELGQAVMPGAQVELALQLEAGSDAAICCNGMLCIGVASRRLL